MLYFQTPVMEGLARELECPVCLLTPRQPPIFICPLGHNICQECRPRLARCPVCKEKFTPGARNYFAEKILDQLERKCRFEIFNCDFSTCDSQDLVHHENICDKKQTLQDLLKPDDKSDEDDAENQHDDNPIEDNLAPVMLNLNLEYDYRPMQHYLAFTVVFLRAFINQVCFKLNIWSELAFILLVILIIGLRRSKIFLEFIENFQPDPFNNQVEPLRNNLRFLTYRVSNQYFQCLVYWIILVIWIIALMKVPHVFPVLTDNQTRIAFYVFKARLDVLKPLLVVMTSFFAVLYHVIFERNRLDRKLLLRGVSLVILPVVCAVNVELFKHVGSSFIDQTYCLIFWIQVLALPMSHARVCLPLLQLLGLASVLFYLSDNFLNDEQHNVNLEDIYNTFKEGYLWKKFERERYEIR